MRAAQLDLYDYLRDYLRKQAIGPAARHSDPDTSHRAAAVVKQGSAAMNAEILETVRVGRLYSAPLTAFEIAAYIQVTQPRRWDEGSIRTAVSRLGKRGLLVKDGKGKSPRGQACDKWRLP